MLTKGPKWIVTADRKPCLKAPTLSRDRLLQRLHHRHADAFSPAR
jgi:hypothetical protein